jgi:hypothetical protein
MADSKQELIEKFVDTSVWDIRKALEGCMSDLGIAGTVPGVYDLNSVLMILIKGQQDLAKKYLSENYSKLT